MLVKEFEKRQKMCVKQPIYEVGSSSFSVLYQKIGKFGSLLFLAFRILIFYFNITHLVVLLTRNLFAVLKQNGFFELLYLCQSLLKSKTRKKTIKIL